MSDQVQYLTNEQGRRIGVLLDLDTYHRLIHGAGVDNNCLIGLNQLELKALAESLLAPAAQSRLDELVACHAENPLSGAELAELDSLLAQVDYLTLLKTRARYTLQSLENLFQVS